MRRLALLAIGALLATLAFSACGGDGDEPAGEPAGQTAEGEPLGEAPLTRAEFDSEMDRICAEAEAGAEEIAAEIEQRASEFEERAGDAPPDQLAQEFAAVFQEALEEHAIPLFEELLAEFEAVDPPPRIARDYEAFVGVIRDQLALLRDRVEVLDHDPSAVLETDDRVQRRLTQRADRLTESLGLPDACGAPAR